MREPLKRISSTACSDRCSTRQLAVVPGDRLGERRSTYRQAGHRMVHSLHPLAGAGIGSGRLRRIVGTSSPRVKRRSDFQRRNDFSRVKFDEVFVVKNMIAADGLAVVSAAAPDFGELQSLHQVLMDHGGEVFDGAAGFDDKW